MPIITIAFGFFALTVGLIIIQSNPRRRLNQVFFVAAFIQFLWIACISGAMHAGSKSDLKSVELLLKLNAVIAAFFPLGIWLTKEVVVSANKIAEKLKHSLPWIAACLILAGVTFHDSFLAKNPETDRLERGGAYYVYQALSIFLYFLLVTTAVVQMRRLEGLKRIETQFFVLNLGLGSLLAAAFTTLGNAFDSTAIKRLSVAVFFIVYLATAWSITAYKIFDVKQVLVSSAQRILVILLPGVAIVFFISILDNIIHPIVASLISVFTFIFLAFWLERWTRIQLDLDGKRRIAKSRQLFIELSANEADTKNLVDRFSAALSREFSTDRAILLIPAGDNYTPDSFSFTKARCGHAALCNIGWATPESISRRRCEDGLADLHQFLERNNFGAIVATPPGSRRPSLLIALGEKDHGWPFTFPEVQRLQSVAGLIDSTLSGSQLATHVAERSKVENMKIISQGLAHDLRNLITPVCSFLLHTEGRFLAGTPEAEVHSEAKQSVKVMKDYIMEALFFSQQLSPDFTTLRISHIFSSVRDLVISQAKPRGVRISIRSEYDITFVGDFALLKRLLINLINNAVDASASGNKIRVTASRGQRDRFLIKVSDNGSGIEPKNLEKIFDPYFTTKDRGECVRGFGLGLTICRKIAELHGGSIAAESVLGRGTLITVSLPVSPACNGAHQPKDVLGILAND